MAPAARPSRPASATSATSGRADDASAAEATASGGRDAALRFVGRLARLDLAGLVTVLATWRETMRSESPAWFAAEEAVGRAVVVSGRHQEQKPLLMHVADAFAHRVWYAAERPDGRVEPAPELSAQGTEASGQYVATLAMLALLVREHLEPASFALLYRPFAATIPLADLGRE